MVKKATPNRVPRQPVALRRAGEVVQLPSGQMAAPIEPCSSPRAFPIGGGVFAPALYVACTRPDGHEGDHSIRLEEPGRARIVISWGVE